MKFPTHIDELLGKRNKRGINRGLPDLGSAYWAEIRDQRLKWFERARERGETRKVEIELPSRDVEQLVSLVGSRGVSSETLEDLVRYII